MTLKTFIIGMLLSFGLAWMCMIAVPASKMSTLPPVKINEVDEDAPYYQRMVAGRVKDGSLLYASNGCYYCHSQLIRPTYLGRQIWRDDVAGVINDDGDTRRETSHYDYDGEDFAQIGRTRMGPDLSNFGHRAAAYAKLAGMTADEWVINHLYNPRNSNLFRGEKGQKIDRSWSNCPSQKQMFDEVSNNGHGGDIVISTEDNDKLVVPNEEALTLTSYLLSLKRDDALPEKLANPVEGAEAAENAE